MLEVEELQQVEYNEPDQINWTENSERLTALQRGKALILSQIAFKKRELEEWKHNIPKPQSPNFWKDLVTFFDLKQVGRDVLSALPVSVALIPEAIAFSFVAGVAPLLGLYASFILPIITSIFGGRPGSITAATGAIAILQVDLVANHEIEYLFAALILTGILQAFVGVFRLARFIKLVSLPIMSGFANGLAIIIGRAQFDHFKSLDGEWVSGAVLGWMIGMVLLSMIIVFFWPRIPYIGFIPSPLVAIGLCLALEQGIGLGTLTVGDKASVGGSFPALRAPDVPFSAHTLSIIFPPAVLMCIVGLIETLMVLRLVDEATETKGQPNRECCAQGLGNFICGFFGAMGGCAMIGQTMININGGGRGRISTFAVGILLLFIILVAHSVIELIPLAALIGVMFVVVIKTFDWNTFRVIYQSIRYYRVTGTAPLLDAFVILLVTLVTVFTDLALGVGCGIVFSCLVYSWKNSQRISLSTYVKPNGVKVYVVQGVLFFASANTFQDLFHPQDDPAQVEVDFQNSKLEDLSAVGALNDLVIRYHKMDKEITFVNLNDKSSKYIHYGGLLSKEIRFVTLPE
jgi:SulP family sulfate permease